MRTIGIILIAIGFAVRCCLLIATVRSLYDKDDSFWHILCLAKEEMRFHPINIVCISLIIIGLTMIIYGG